MKCNKCLKKIPQNEEIKGYGGNYCESCYKIVVESKKGVGGELFAVLFIFSVFLLFFIVIFQAIIKDD